MKQSTTSRHPQFKLFSPMCHLARALMRLSLVLFCALFLTAQAQAQADGGATDFSLFLGYMLPNQIPSVVDNLALFGGRYSYIFPFGAIESEIENSHSRGVDWTQGSVSFRAVTPFSPGIDAMVYAGPDILWYIPNGATQRQFDYGIHVGLAAAAQIKDNLWIRADLKFLGNPGTALYLLGGIMFRPAGSSSP